MSNKRTFTHNTLLSALFYSSIKKPQNIYDLSEKLVKLENSGLNRGITVSRVAGGYHSQLLEEYYGAFELAGDANSRNPVKLTKSGLEICSIEIRNSLKEAPDETKKLLKTLGLENDFSA